MANPSPARPPSPPLSVLALPPLLPGRTSSSSSTSDSLSSILTTPSDSTDLNGRRSIRAPPPSAFQRPRSNASFGSFFKGEDTRADVLKTLNIIETEWELVDPSSVPSDTPKRRGSRKLKAIMSMADSAPRVPTKKPSFLRRLTGHNSQQTSPPPPPQGPPQLPRLSTLLHDDAAPVISPNPKYGGMNGASTPPSHSRSGSNGLMSGTMFGRELPHTPQSSLPPGAEAARMTSPNGGGQTWQPNPSPGGFRVQGRSNDTNAAPVSAPHARPNGTPIAAQHRQHSTPNGPASPMANGHHGPRPMPNGMHHGTPYGAPNGMPNGAPNGMDKALPNSPPAKPLPNSPPMQQSRQLPNGMPASAPKPLPNSPPMAPPKQLSNGPPARPPPPSMMNGPPGARPPQGMPNGMPNGPASPPLNQQRSQLGPRVGDVFNHRQMQPRPTLPPGAGQGPVPTAGAHSPPMSQSKHHQFSSEGPMGAAAQLPRPPQQTYTRPPLLNGNGPASPPPQQRSMGRMETMANSPPQQHQQRPLPSSPQVQTNYNSQPFGSAPPPVAKAQSTPMPQPQMQARPPQQPPNQPGQATYPTPSRAAPAPPTGPPAQRKQSYGAPPHGAAPMPSTATRSAPVQHAPPGSRPGEHAVSPPHNSHRSAAETASGATVHVIASSDPSRHMPASPPAGNTSSAGTGGPTQTTPTRPKIVIPSGHTSPPPQPQPYTAPVLAAANSATTPQAEQPRGVPFGREKPARLQSPIDFAHVPSGQNNTDARPPSEPRNSNSSGHSGLGNGHPSTAPLSTSQLAPRTRPGATQARRIASSPLASPSVSSASSPVSPSRPAAFAAQQRRVVSHPRVSATASEAPSASSSPVSSVTARGSRPTSVMERLRPKRQSLDPTLTALLKHPRITMSLLPNLNINSFLNVLGSDDELRKYVTGEMVGRWVMREWGITIERERGRSWPGLTVWEGFLESLLHDPAVYSTYPAQYHNLLRHLSLSHTLIVLFLRTLPPSAFPYAPPLPFDDDLQLPVLHKSSSVGSFHSMNGNGNRWPGSRPGSRATSHGSDSGMGGSKMPRRERVTEVIMPEPLSAGPRDAAPPLPIKDHGQPRHRRRGSIGSIASATQSFGFKKKRSNSTSSLASEAFYAEASSAQPATPVPQGKAAYPPVSYPTAKRYEFRRYGDKESLTSPGGMGPPSSRPGSIMSVQSSNFGPSRMGSMRSFDHLPVPPPIGGGSRRGPRSSLTSSSSKRSDIGGSNSPVSRRWDSPTPVRIEPAFDRPPPYMTGRAPILRVFVPVSERVPRWPSAEGAAASWRELEKCGASKRMRLGDLVVNTALHKPTNTEHVLIYVPFVQHKLVPLEYVHGSTGHLPHYLDAFALSPTYYDPFLPTPQIVYLDFAPYAQQAMNSVRLAYDRRDMTTASGARISAKRYLHVAGIEITQGDRVAPEWQGMISLEAEGTAEGRQAMEQRFGFGDPSRAVMGPWEVVRERSMLGSLWLRLIPEQQR